MNIAPILLTQAGCQIHAPPEAPQSLNMGPGLRQPQGQMQILAFCRQGVFTQSCNGRPICAFNICFPHTLWQIWILIPPSIPNRIKSPLIPQAGAARVVPRQRGQKIFRRPIFNDSRRRGRVCPGTVIVQSILFFQGRRSSHRIKAPTVGLQKERA